MLDRPESTRVPDESSSDQSMATGASRIRGLAPSRMRRALTGLLLLVVPALLWLPASLMHDAIGPYWMSANIDPSYAYLFNSVLVARGRGPAHTDHPGTPVQLIGAAVVRLRHALDRASPLQTAVVANPESYLRWINRCLMAAVVGATCLIGWSVFRLTSSLWAAGVCQALPFTSLCVWQKVVLVSPEPLLLALSLTLSSLLLCHFRSISRTSGCWPLAFGAVVGLGVATKLTFLPLALVPLLILPGWPHKRKYLVTGCCGFLLATAPIWRSYPRFCMWIASLLTHRGRYGSGESGFHLAEYLQQLQQLALREPALLSIALAAVAYAGLRYAAGRRAGAAAAAPLGLYLLALAAAIFGQFVMVAKHSAPHYLIPAFGLMNAVLALLLLDLLRPGWLHRLGLSIVVAGVAVQGWIGSQSLLTYTHSETAWRQDVVRPAIDLVRAREHQGVVVAYYGASSPTFALAFGNAWAGNICAPAAATLYPPTYFFNVQGKGYTNLAGMAVQPEQIFGSGAPVYFHGSPLHKPGAIKPDGFSFRPLLKEELEVVYEGQRLTDPTDSVDGPPR